MNKIKTGTKDERLDRAKKGTAIILDSKSEKNETNDIKMKKEQVSKRSITSNPIGKSMQRSKHFESDHKYCAIFVCFFFSLFLLVNVEHIVIKLYFIVSDDNIWFENHIRH